MGREYLLVWFPILSANIVVVLELKSAVFVMAKDIVKFQFMVKKFGRKNVRKGDGFIYSFKMRLLHGYYTVLNNHQSILPNLPRVLMRIHLTNAVNGLKAWVNSSLSAVLGTGRPKGKLRLFTFETVE